jgi:CRISPR-associated protein Csm4
MKLYKTTIKPVSTFATDLQGDTLFGQMCWAIRYGFGEEKLKTLLSSYKEEPFMIVSDGFASGYLPKPSLPSNLLSENPDDKKINRRKIWLKSEYLQNAQFSKAKTNKEIGYVNEKASVVKNSINYKTFTTGDEGFDPYSEEEIQISDHDIYILLDEEKFSLEDLQKSMTIVSEMGFGKNSSIGKGRFSFSDFVEVSLPKQNSNVFMTLSNSTLEELECKNVFYTPITKFAKHGASLATASAFKKPLLLAKSGSVIVFVENKSVQYIGKAIKGHSAYKETVHQGYSIAIPLKENLL